VYSKLCVTKNLNSTWYWSFWSKIFLLTMSTNPKKWMQHLFVLFNSSIMQG